MFSKLSVMVASGTQNLSSIESELDKRSRTESCGTSISRGKITISSEVAISWVLMARREALILGTGLGWLAAAAAAAAAAVRALLLKG